MARPPEIVHRRGMSLGDATLDRHAAGTRRTGTFLIGAAALLLPLGALDEAYGITLRLISGEPGTIAPLALVGAAWFIVIGVLLVWRLRVDADARRWVPATSAMILGIAALRLGGSPSTVIAVAMAIVGVMYLRGDADRG